MMLTEKVSEARQRILLKAEELFYRQGYKATGINQIIEESGVAKATFYAHFPSKDDLCLAYLQTVSRREAELFRKQISEIKSPLKRFMHLIESLEPWLKATNLKGCAFLNMIPEIPDPSSPLRQEGKYAYREYEKIIRDLAEELIDSDPKKYARLDAGRTAREYMTIMAGAIALVELYHELEPVREGVRMVRALVG
jgi:AcrR family transcriptional regulator